MVLDWKKCAFRHSTNVLGCVSRDKTNYNINGWERMGGSLDMKPLGLGHTWQGKQP